MPIHRRTNPYRGVNAHYNSLLQVEFDGWRPFHTHHVVMLSKALNEHLPEHYYALEKKSLQVETTYQDESAIRWPDIELLYNPKIPKQDSHQVTETNLTPIAEVVAELLFSVPDELTAVHIYARAGGSIPVTSIEILSPTNKINPANYLYMRNQTIQAGIHLVELDYLHRHRGLFRQVLADYSRQQPNAYPYTIGITLAQPSEASKFGITCFYGVHVDEPLPLLRIPLLAGEFFYLELDPIYQETHDMDRRVRQLDYSEVPTEFERYSPIDQQYILARMEALRLEEIPSRGA